VTVKVTATETNPEMTAEIDDVTTVMRRAKTGKRK
jgi:hypothetical protein